MRNQWQAFLTAWVDHRAQDERLTRGGPSMGTPLGWVTVVQLRSNFAASTQWNARVFYGRDESGGLTYRLSTGLALRPAPRWSFSVGPNYLRSIDPRQYVLTRADTLATTTYGARYVFAEIEQSQWSVPIRFNFAFTPDLTLEVYGEPFIASGRYDRFGELPAPRRRDLRVYGEAAGTAVAVDSAGTRTVTADGTTFVIGNRDFNVASFRSNVVLRWEWRRGSTLFLVWQMNRGSSEPRGDLVRIPDLFRGLRADGDNFFAVKMTYWLAAR